MYIVRFAKEFLGKKGKLQPHLKAAAKFETKPEAKAAAIAANIPKFSIIALSTLALEAKKKAEKAQRLTGMPFPHYSKPACPNL